MYKTSFRRETFKSQLYFIDISDIAFILKKKTYGDTACAAVKTTNCKDLDSDRS